MKIKIPVLCRVKSKIMRILSFVFKITLFALLPVLFVMSCKKENPGPCPEGDPAIIGARCNSGTLTNETGSDACSFHGGVNHWICSADSFHFATISGTVTIDHADKWVAWKDSGEVQLVIFPAFSLNPPSGWGDVPDNFFGPGVPGGRFALGAPYNAQNPIVINYTPGIGGFTYEMQVDPGTYSALALGFRHNRITNPSLRTATLGVHWDHPNEVSHGIVLKIDTGGGNIVTLFNEPAPSTFTVEKGDDLRINFKADFAFVEQWFQ